MNEDIMNGDKTIAAQPHSEQTQQNNINKSAGKRTDAGEEVL